MICKFHVGQLVREILEWQPCVVYSRTGKIAQPLPGSYIGLRLQEVRQRYTTKGAPLQDGQEDCPFNSKYFRPLDKLRVEDFMGAFEPA